MAIVGGGVVGLGAAWALAKRGVPCALLDALPRRTERNASNDESKVFRVAYGEREDYSRLALASLEGWRTLEREARRRVLHPHGLVMLGRTPDSFAAQSHATLQRLDREPAWTEGAEVGQRYAAFAGAGFAHAALDRDGGLLDPPAVLEALETEAIARGARVHRDRHVMALEQEGRDWACVLGHGRVRARRVIVAAGYRAPLLLPELAPFLSCTRQPEFAFAPRDPAPFEPPALPVFAAFEDGFYGFPLHRGAVKVADHRKGPEAPWEPPRDPPTAAEERSCRAWLARAMPGLADAPMARSRLCHYDNSPDDDFLLGPHPAREGLVLAAGLSGHGFKFAPVLGEALAAWALGEEPHHDLRAWSPARFLGAGSGDKTMDAPPGS